MNETIALVIIIILGMILLFLIPFLIKFTKQNKEQHKIIKTLEEKVNKPKLTDSERKLILDSVRCAVMEGQKPINNNVDTSNLKGLLNEDLMEQIARLTRLNNEILFKENRTEELENSIATLKNEINIVQEFIKEKQNVMVAVDNETTNKRNALIDMLTRAQVDRDQVITETQALLGEKLRLQKDIEENKKCMALGQQNVAEVERRLTELVNLEKEMRLRNAQEVMERGTALEFDDIELVEIKELREVMSKLRNATPLEKAIYEIYYRDKMKRLVGVLGLDGVSGIYRIWTVESGIEKSYVGQSVDVGAR